MPDTHDTADITQRLDYSVFESVKKVYDSQGESTTFRYPIFRNFWDTLNTVYKTHRSTKLTCILV